MKSAAFFNHKIQNSSYHSHSSRYRPLLIARLTHSKYTACTLASQRLLLLDPGPYHKYLQAAMSPLFILALLAPLAAAFDCSKDLEAYDFQSIKGTYLDTILIDRPPSKTDYTWSIGICQDVENQADCPAKSSLCGVGHLKVDDKDILSEVIPFKSDHKHTFRPFDEQNSGVLLILEDLSWGDSSINAHVKFICSENDNPDNNKLRILRWTGRVFEANFLTPAACVKDKKDKNGKDNQKPPSEDGGESWGWFTWIFIFMVLFLSIYIIGGAWFQYNKGNSIDFQSALREVLENFVDLLRGLPTFFKEVVEKVTGNSSRNEYSAV
ncbi:hypothetical protein PUMCH_004431 [Australozyma saopauloensis]|uniref:Autophagy-related protein 27 n=1 Tax=Australozyma saopauloensis TaxID=291208 RepID=A0AAX4HH66_9ASCO|nr:hypothetical protein PUMCH_004431 [[Candida] saopauloensis]